MFFHLGLKEGLHLLKRLTLLGISLDEEEIPVGPFIRGGVGFQHLLLLEEIQIQQAGQAITQHLARNIGIAGLFGGVAGRAPTHQYEF